MRIVHVQQYYNDGMGYQENIFPKYQAKLGHEVILITSNLGYGFKGMERNFEIGEYREEGVLVKRIKIKREFKNRFVIFENLMEEIEKLKPDYIYHHSVTSPSIKTVCEYKKKNPKVFLVTDNHADLTISGRNKLWKTVYYNTFWKKIIQKYCGNVDMHFGVTPSRCLFLQEELGIDKNKIKLLPIGADTEAIKNLDEEILKKYNINNDNFKIVHGGKITKAKEADKLIRAFQKIDAKNINLILFGKIEDEEIKEMIKKDIRIIYLGWLSRRESLSLLKKCDLGIWNTQHTTLLEDAIAVRLPLILRYYGSTSHLIDGNGLFLYGNSEKEIYDKIQYLFKEKEALKIIKMNTEKMSNILTYDIIAKTSVKYINEEKYKSVYDKFNDINYSDIEFEEFRKLKKE